MPAASMPLNGTPPQTAPKTDAGPGTSLLKVFLIAIGIFQAHNALFHLLMLAMSLQDATPPQLSWVTVGVILVDPFVVVAALFFAAKNRFRHAIMAVATLGLLDWLNYMPSFTKQGLDIGTSVAALFGMFYLFVLPILCIAGFVLAARNLRLWIAAVLATAPTIMLALGIAMFAAGVAIYGF